jgi:nitrite reductase (NADH) small subunit
MNTEPRWTPITEAVNIPPRQGRRVTVGGKELAIFNINGRFLTVDNRCPHRGGPLSDGIVAGATIVCPLHGWRFDLESGLAARATAPACVSVFPTRVENGIVFVDVEAGLRADESSDEGIGTEAASISR